MDVLHTLVSTLQGKIILGIGLGSLVISQIVHLHFFGIVSHLFIYLAVAYNAGCLVKGDCDVWSWVTLSGPILWTLTYMVMSFKNRRESESHYDDLDF